MTKTRSLVLKNAVGTLRCSTVKFSVASNLASCKSQGLRARDGDKSHKIGRGKGSRVKVGGHKIKGHKYGGPLPDWGTRK